MDLQEDYLDARKKIRTGIDPLETKDKYGRKEGKIRKDGTIVDNYGRRTGKIK